MEVDEEGVVASDFDCLPFDCLVCICEYLSPKDLCRFGAVCKLFHEASLVAHLWRYHCLMRWTFCDIFQIPEGEQRWRRYFLARRKVDASMDAGRPTRDYRLKTLRGHQSDIISAEVVGGSGINWEDPKPPLVVSLSMDKTAKAWDVLQGKAVWSREGDVTCISADSGSGEVAVGLTDGSVILLDSASEWEEQAAFQITPDNSPIRVVKYGHVKQSNLPKPFLMIVSDNKENTEVWGALPATPPTSTDDDAGVGCLFSLRTPHHDPRALQLCEASGLLAVPRVTAPDIDVWNLLVASSSAHSSPPLHPHLTIRTTSSCIPQWLSPGLLATRGGVATLNPWVRADTENKIELWDVLGEIKAKKKAILSLADDDSIKLYNSTRTITCHASPRTLSAAKNGMLLVGELDGTLEVFDLAHCMKGEGKGEGSTAAASSARAGQGCLQTFADHKGAITDMYADSFRVLTCSKDFSIRVYRWKGREASAVEGKGEGSSSAMLESRYTLLGGSVAMKTHDGFNKVLCEAGNCIGVAGNQLKFYNFTCKFDNPLVGQ